MEECLLSLSKFLLRKASEVNMHRRTRWLDMMIDSMFGRNMRKQMKLGMEYLRVFLLNVLEL